MDRPRNRAERALNELDRRRLAANAITDSLALARQVAAKQHREHIAKDIVPEIKTEAPNALTRLEELGFPDGQLIDHQQTKGFGPFTRTSYVKRVGWEVCNFQDGIHNPDGDPVTYTSIYLMADGTYLRNDSHSSRGGAWIEQTQLKSEDFTFLPYGRPEAILSALKGLGNEKPAS